MRGRYGNRFSPGAAELNRSSPGAAELNRSSPGAAELNRANPGATDVGEEDSGMFDDIDIDIVKHVTRSNLNLIKFCNL